MIYLSWEISIIQGKYKNMANDEVGGIDIFLKKTDEINTTFPKLKD